jgi:hypothetical protein
MSENKMIEFIRKWGCVPRTVFEISMDEEQLGDKESKIRSARDVERLTHMIGSSQIDHDVVSGTFLRIIPIISYAVPGVVGEYVRADESDSCKREANVANVDEIGLSNSHSVAQFKSQYTKITYMWASDYIRDLAFDGLLTLGGDRMLPLIANYQHSTLGGFRGLLLEPFVFNLLTNSALSAV